jgi:hypothetical protein
MRPMLFRNVLNGEQFVCDDTRHVELIDGIEYLIVHRVGEHRVFKMRRDILKKDSSMIERRSQKIAKKPNK